jgi:hypothetical protein
MKFVALWSLKPDADQAKLAEIMGRRAEYEFPEGVEVLGEYWSVGGPPQVISIFDADNAVALSVNSVVWMDALTVEVFPVVTWEEGLEGLTEYLAG